MADFTGSIYQSDHFQHAGCGCWHVLTGLLVHQALLFGMVNALQEHTTPASLIPLMAGV